MSTELWKMSALELAAAVARGEVGALRGGGRPPRADRGGEPRGQCGHERPRRLRADAAQGDRPPTRRGRGPRPPGRGAVHDQGEHRRGGLGDHERRARASSRRGGRRCAHRAAAPRGRRDPDRAHQHAGPLDRPAHPQPALRRHRQPLGCEPHPGRVERRRGGGARDGDVAAGPRQRRGGIGAHPALFGGVAALKPSYGRFPGDRSVGPRDLSLSSQLIPVDGVARAHRRGPPRRLSASSPARTLATLAWCPPRSKGRRSRARSASPSSRTRAGSASIRTRAPPWRRPRPRSATPATCSRRSTCRSSPRSATRTVA